MILKISLDKIIEALVEETMSLRQSSELQWFGYVKTKGRETRKTVKQKVLKWFNYIPRPV